MIVSLQYISASLSESAEVLKFVNFLIDIVCNEKLVMAPRIILNQAITRSLDAYTEQ